MNEQQSKAFEEFYFDLLTKDGERKIFTLTKSMERESRELDQHVLKMMENFGSNSRYWREMGELFL